MVEYLIVLRHDHRVTQCTATRQNRNLGNRRGVAQGGSHESVTALMVRGYLPLVLTHDARSTLGPAITRSIASSIARSSITLPLSRAVSRAASFITFARSAPVKPGVRLATCPNRRDGRSAYRRRCTSRMRWRPSYRARPHRSGGRNDPGAAGRGRAHPGGWVAAITITLELPSKPSISTSSWLRVCSRSSLPPPMPTRGGDRPHRSRPRRRLRRG